MKKLLLILAGFIVGTILLWSCSVSIDPIEIKPPPEPFKVEPIKVRHKICDCTCGKA